MNSAKGVLEETIEKRENFKNQFIEEARNELQIAQRELSQSDETMKKLKDSLNRTTITAPVDGVVKNLFFVTEGGVIKPGGSIFWSMIFSSPLPIEITKNNCGIIPINVAQKKL